MKKTILFLTTLLSVVLLHAQTEKPSTPISNEDFFKQAELVFEGYFLRYVDSYDTKGEGKSKDCITIDAFKVTRVYKGDTSLTGGIVYQLTTGLGLGLENLYVGNTISGYWCPSIFRRNGINQGVNEHSPRIFFFVSTDLPDDANSKYFSHKKYKHLRDSFQGDIDDVYVYKDKVLGLNNLVFHNREDFYNYMKQFEGFTVPEVEAKIEIQPKQESPEDALKYENTLDSLFRERYGSEWDELKKKVQEKPKNSKEYNTITLEISNQQLTYNNVEQKHFIDFDLMVSSNNPNIYVDAITTYIYNV